MKSFKELIVALKIDNSKIRSITNNDTLIFIQGCTHCHTIDSYLNKEDAIQVAPFQIDELKLLTETLFANTSVTHLDKNLLINIENDPAAKLLLYIINECLKRNEKIFELAYAQRKLSQAENKWGNRLQDFFGMKSAISLLKAEIDEYHDQIGFFNSQLFTAIHSLHLKEKQRDDYDFYQDFIRKFPICRNHISLVIQNDPSTSNTTHITALKM